MKRQDSIAAITLAKAAVDTSDDVPAVCVPVRRLDRNAEYVLVQLGYPGEPGWVAAVDLDKQEVLTWARNPSGASTVPAYPGSTEHGDKVEYVWRPSAYSRSPLYPLLRVASKTGELFVDLSGATHRALPDAQA